MENLTRGLMPLVPPPPAHGGYRNYGALGDTSSVTYSGGCLQYRDIQMAVAFLTTFFAGRRYRVCNKHCIQLLSH